MPIGKAAKDIFARTSESRRPQVALENAPRGERGRPPIEEPYEKSTIILYKRQVIALDKLALAITEATGRRVKKSELIRAMIEQAVDGLDPATMARPDVEKIVKRLKL